MGVSLDFGMAYVPGTTRVQLGTKQIKVLKIMQKVSLFYLCITGFISLSNVCPFIGFFTLIRKCVTIIRLQASVYENIELLSLIPDV